MTGGFGTRVRPLYRLYSMEDYLCPLDLQVEGIGLEHELGMI